MYVSDCISIVVFSFLAGSIPFGVLLAGWFGLPDPRGIGSGNIGATNMLRTGRKDIAALTLLLDALKGTVPVLVVSGYGGEPRHMALALLAALLGHCYTPWLDGKGGKGVATALGGALAMGWVIGAAFCTVWLVTFFITRYVSIASILGLLAIPLSTLFHCDAPSAIILSLAALVGIWRHRGNIGRIRAGIEPQMLKTESSGAR